MRTRSVSAPGSQIALRPCVLFARGFVDVICEGGSHGRCAGASPAADGQPFASSSCASRSVRGLSPGLCCPLVCIANPDLPPSWIVQDNYCYVVESSPSPSVLLNDS